MNAVCKGIAEQWRDPEWLSLPHDWQMQPLPSRMWQSTVCQPIWQIVQQHLLRLLCFWWECNKTGRARSKSASTRELWASGSMQLKEGVYSWWSIRARAEGSLYFSDYPNGNHGLCDTQSAISELHKLGTIAWRCLLWQNLMLRTLASSH